MDFCCTCPVHWWTFVALSGWSFRFYSFNSELVPRLVMLVDFCCTCPVHWWTFVAATWTFVALGSGKGAKTSFTRLLTACLELFSLVDFCCSKRLFRWTFVAPTWTFVAIRWTFVAVHIGGYAVFCRKNRSYEA